MATGIARYRTGIFVVLLAAAALVWLLTPQIEDLESVGPVSVSVTPPPAELGPVAVVGARTGAEEAVPVSDPAVADEAPDEAPRIETVGAAPPPEAVAPAVRVISLRGSDDPESPEQNEHLVDTSAVPEEQKEMFLLSRDGIRSAIGSVRAEIRECYESWLQLEEEIEGRLVLGIIVEAVDVPGEGEEDAREGRVSDVEIKETDFDHPLLQGCIANVIGDLRFNEPRDGFSHITYPFVFRLGANQRSE